MNFSINAYAKQINAIGTNPFGNFDMGMAINQFLQLIAVFLVEVISNRDMIARHDVKHRQTLQTHPATARLVQDESQVMVAWSYTQM